MYIYIFVYFWLSIYDVGVIFLFLAASRYFVFFGICCLHLDLFACLFVCFFLSFLLFVFLFVFFFTGFKIYLFL